MVHADRRGRVLGACVIARGVYFEPGIFDGFGQALAFLQSFPGVL